MVSNLNQLAREVVNKNQYLALNTIDENKNPWTCVLAYTFDKEYNFYFVSLPASNHSMHIERNSRVSFAIYDSTQGFGTGIGLQIEAVAKKLKDSELPGTMKIYFGRKYPYGNLSNSFTDGLRKLLENKTYSFYKLTPTHVWMNNPNADTDKRVAVKL